MTRMGRTVPSPRAWRIAGMEVVLIVLGAFVGALSTGGVQAWDAWRQQRLRRKVAARIILGDLYVSEAMFELVLQHDRWPDRLDIQSANHDMARVAWVVPWRCGGVGVGARRRLVQQPAPDRVNGPRSVWASTSRRSVIAATSASWFRSLESRGKRRTLIAVAAARELAGFCWAIAGSPKDQMGRAAQ
jgi:hypothetical protein